MATAGTSAIHRRLLICTLLLVLPATAKAQGAGATGAEGVGVTIAVIGGGALALVVDATLLAFAVHYAERGVPDVVAIVELLVGLAHAVTGVAVAAVLLDEGATPERTVGWWIGVGVGSALISHAVWSLASNDVPSVRPRITVGRDVVMLGLEGTLW